MAAWASFPRCWYFYPRPPRGGRRRSWRLEWPGMIFLSTPSARRATGSFTRSPKISSNFYPRPPRGGRRLATRLERKYYKFLSTPSARRATHHGPFLSSHKPHFYPRPPRGGRLLVAAVGFQCHIISIHALREEGDVKQHDSCLTHCIFLSTPSARRATLFIKVCDKIN